MKHFYLLLLLVISHQLSAQWSQVGTDLGFASGDAGVSLVFNPSTNEPYIAYPDGGANAFKIQKFDGTSWSQVGTDLGFTIGNVGVSLVFNPSTNEPYIAYPDGGANAFKIQKFNLIVSIGNLNNFNLNILAFPNPTNSLLNIKLGKSYNTITVKTINSIGIVISTQYFKDTDVIETTVKGSNGLYFIEVSTDFGFIKTIKVIKK